MTTCTQYSFCSCTPFTVIMVVLQYKSLTWYLATSMAIMDYFIIFLTIILFLYSHNLHLLFFLPYLLFFSSYLLFQLFWNSNAFGHHCRFTSLEPTRPMPTLYLLQRIWFAFSARECNCSAEDITHIFVPTECI